MKASFGHKCDRVRLEKGGKGQLVKMSWREAQARAPRPPGVQANGQGFRGPGVLLADKVPIEEAGERRRRGALEPGGNKRLPSPPSPRPGSRNTSSSRTKTIRTNIRCHIDCGLVAPTPPSCADGALSDRDVAPHAGCGRAPNSPRGSRADSPGASGCTRPPSSSPFFFLPRRGPRPSNTAS